MNGLEILYDVDLSTIFNYGRLRTGVTVDRKSLLPIMLISILPQPNDQACQSQHCEQDQPHCDLKRKPVNMDKQTQ
jgi:hypothetical protein